MKRLIPYAVIFAIVIYAIVAWGENSRTELYAQYLHMHFQHIAVHDLKMQRIVDDFDTRIKGLEAAQQHQ